MISYTTKSFVFVSGASKASLRPQSKKLHKISEDEVGWNLPEERKVKSAESVAKKLSLSDGSFTRGQRKRLLAATEVFYNHCRANGYSRSKKGGKVWLKCSFVTLTIIDRRCLIDSSYGYYKLLVPFLKWLARRKAVTAFIWVYEK